MASSASREEELRAELRRRVLWRVACRHVYLRKNRQLKSPIQTMSTKCQ